MSESYGRDLDLNLLRVFQVVADSGSVTEAAARLYLTQPAVSAALRRLRIAIGAQLFVRQGRKLALTNRGEQLRSTVRVHLQSLIDGALSPAEFDPRTSERTIRLGLSDATEVWLLPSLLRVLEKEAPKTRVIAVPIQFRTVAQALTSGSVELAVTVADELPAGIHRQTLFLGDFVCLYDPRHTRIKKRLREADYFARAHVIVSYNGDLRGVVEDALQKVRRVRCSVSSFSNLGSLVEGTTLLATVPRLVARQIQAVRPELRAAELPFSLGSTPMELLWSRSADDDELCRFLRSRIVSIAERAAVSKGRRQGRRSSVPAAGTLD